MKFKFLRVEPPAYRYREEDVLHIPLSSISTDQIEFFDELEKGDTVTLESLQQSRIASSEMADYGDTVEEATQGVIEEVTGEFVNLLNIVLYATGREVSTESNFNLVESIEKVSSE